MEDNTMTKLKMTKRQKMVAKTRQKNTD